MGESSSNNNKSKKVGSGEEVKVTVSAEPQEEDQWDISKVIDQSNEDERSICRNEIACGGANAVLVWKSITLDPNGDDVWPLCVQCSCPSMTLDCCQRDTSKSAPLLTALALTLRVLLLTRIRTTRTKWRLMCTQRRKRKSGISSFL